MKVYFAARTVFTLLLYRDRPVLLCDLLAGVRLRVAAECKFASLTCPEGNDMLHVKNKWTNCRNSFAVFSNTDLRPAASLLRP